MLMSSGAFAAQESETFLTKCFQKDYTSSKNIKRVTFALYENLAGDMFGAMEVQMNEKGTTAGRLTTTCLVDKATYTCTNEKDGGKLTFIEEEKAGTLKVEEPLKLKVENQFTPGKSSHSNLPVAPGLKLAAAIPSACEKLVP